MYIVANSTAQGKVKRCGRNARRAVNEAQLIRVCVMKLRVKVIRWCLWDMAIAVETLDLHNLHELYQVGFDTGSDKS